MGRPRTLSLTLAEWKANDIFLEFNLDEVTTPAERNAYSRRLFGLLKSAGLSIVFTDSYEALKDAKRRLHAKH